MSIRKFFGAARNHKNSLNESRKAARRSSLRKRLLGHETLEDRRLLVSQMFLDFGAGIGMGNTFSTTAQDFRNIFGAETNGTGSDLIGEANGSGETVAGASSLDFTPLSYDFDGSGVIDNADITALGNAVLPIVQRALEPFDIDVVIVGATNLADAVASVGANAGDASGEFDAYNFVMDITSDAFTLAGGSVGDNLSPHDDGDGQDNLGLFGIAAAEDLFAQTGNLHDEATLTFSDTIFASTGGTPGTAAFNENLAHRLAYTATHEAFHTLTYIHTTGPNADQTLLTSGDVIRLGSVTRDDPFIVTRFDLQRQNAFAVAEPNNYLQFANDPDLGLRDANTNGIPDVAYVTGTGAHDRITLTDNGGGIVGVQIQTFSDAARTAAIATENYTIDLTSETDGVILIDASINSDEVIIDGSIAATIRVRGGEGQDGVPTDNDILTLDADGNSVTYDSLNGSLLVPGGATILVSETEGDISVLNAATITLNGSANSDQLTVSRDAGGNRRITGIIDGNAFVPLRFDNVPALALNGLGGDDTLTVDYVNGNPIPAGGIDYDGGGQGAGGDTLIVNDGTFTTITSNYTNANDGNVNLDGSIITYTGLEPVLLNVGTVADIIFNLPAGANPDVLLADDTAANFPANGLSVANTSAIDGSTFEYTSFTNPTTSLTVNGNTSADAITLQAMDAAYAAATNINTDSGDDTVVVLATTAGTTTAIDTGPGGLDAVFVGRTSAMAAGSGSLANIAGNIATTDNANYDLTIDNGADSADHAWNVTSPAAGAGLVTISGISGTIRYETFPANDVTLQAGGGDDSFVVDFTGGAPNDPAPFVDLNIVAGGQNLSDRLTLQGGPTFGTVTHNFTNDNDGSVDVDGSSINYTGLEPILDNLDVNNRVFNFAMASTAIELTQFDATHTRIESPVNEMVDFTTPNTSLDINLASGVNTVTVTDLSGDYDTLTNTIDGNDGVDSVNFERLANAGGGSNWTVNGGGASDIVNLSPVAEDLDNLLGTVVFNGDSGPGADADADVLNVNDDANADGDTFAFTATSITRPTGTNFLGATYNIDVNQVNLDTGLGDDTINVLSTTSAVAGATVIDGQEGNDTFNITGSGLGSGSNTFNGDQGTGADGNDRFFVNLDAAGGLANPATINGDGQVADFRDEVEIVELAAAARTVDVNYTTTDLVTIGGIGALLTVTTSETLGYSGTAANDDVVNVNGAAAEDTLLTVAPIAPDRAIVFNGGLPFDGPPQDFSTRYPGIAGGSVAPDLDISGVLNLTGLNIADAGGADDILYIYGESENGLTDAAGTLDDPFGFGVGLLLPAVGVPAAYDTIDVTDTATTVDALVRVNYNTTDFVRTDATNTPAVVVNAGDEPTNPGPTVGVDVADDITLSPSAAYRFQINGIDPDPATTGIVPPDGDRLNVANPGSVIDIYSDKATPPNVSVAFPGSGFLPFGFSSIENLLLDANNGTVNLIGDNGNAPGTDQTDNFVVVGRDIDALLGPGPLPADAGQNEMQLNINGSNPILIDNVEFLNAFGHEEVDTLDITPYADDTPRGWGIDVFYDEGLPAGADGDQADLLIVHTSLFGGMVSEDIVIRPSGPDNGEVVITNGSFGTPIVDIDYVGNTDIIVLDDDGFANDTDTLTLLGTNPDNPGTSGNETVVADFTAAGTLVDPLISFNDGGTILYRLRNMVGFDALTLDLLGGNDQLTVLGQNNGGGLAIDTLEVLGGSGNDTLILDNSDGLSDMPGGITYHGGDGNDQLQLIGTTAVTTATYNVGPTVDAGTVMHTLGGATQTVNFTGLEPVVDLVPAATLVINATNADNAITYEQSEINAAWGKISIDGFEPIHFANKTNVVINALGGSDSVSLNNPTVPTGLTGITVNGGDPSTDSDSVEIIGTAADDTFAYTPTATNGGTVTQGGAIAMTYTLATVESLAIDAVGQAATDALTVTTTNATITPGSDPGTGIVDPVSAIGEPLLSASYAGMETATVTGTTAVIQGTAEDDTITVSAAGVVTVTNELGFTNSVDVSAFTAVVINALGGDDNITVTPSANLAVSVIGGDNGDGSDTLTFNGTGGDVTLDLAAGTVTEAGIAASTMSYTGIEHVNIDAAGGALLTTGTAGNDTYTVTPLGAAMDGRFTHNLSPGVDFTYDNSATVTFADIAGGGGVDTIEILGDEVVDLVTATASTVTVDGSTVTVGGGIEALKLETFGGDDNINLTGFTNGGNAMEVEIYAGIGDDTVRGSDLDDVTYGGAGNDILIGGLGNDTQHGEDGVDTFGNADTTTFGAADDPGNDRNFGGAGFDNFIWEPGDGQDVNHGGDDGADVFFFVGNAGDNTFSLNPGGTPTHFNAVFGPGQVDNHGIEDVRLVMLGGADTINVNDLTETEVVSLRIDLGSADGAADTVNVQGRTTADDLSITSPATGSVSIEGLAYDVNLTQTEMANDVLVVNGNAGDDTIKAVPGVENEIAITLNGGVGDDYLSADAILNGGAGNDILIGGAGDDTINGNDGDDIIDGRGGNNTIDGGNGTDTILVSGTAAGETLSTVHTAGNLTVTGGVSAGANAITNMEQVRVEAGDGSDTINITTLAAGGLDYEVLGGNPIGAVGDTLNLNSPNGLTFMPGPENDSGAFIDAVTANVVSFDEIEAAGVVIGPALGALTIMGTGDDDEITVVGLAPNSVSVQVNDGPAIVYAGVNTLNVQGKAGDDDITVDINDPALAITINLDGGLPTTDQDRVRVTGVAGQDDTPNWTPSTGVLQLLGQSPINVTAVEQLVYDGEGDNETLTVTGDGNTNDTFVHTPGATPDAGSMQIDSLLGIEYEDLGAGGSVTADGLGGTDTLVAGGTSSDDAFDVAATTGAVSLVTPSATHLTLNQTEIEYLILDGLDGNDVFTLNGSTPYANIDVLGGGPGASDLLIVNDTAAAADVISIIPGIRTNGQIQHNALLISYVGVEHLDINASGDAGDALTVNDDGADNHWTVSAAPNATFGDRVQIDDRESIDYNGFDTVDLTNGFGTDIFDVHPLRTSGFTTSLTVNGERDDDVLNIYGSEAADTITSTADTVTVATALTFGRTVTVGNTNFAELRIVAMGGDDVIGHDGLANNPAPLALALAGVRKVIDAGDGNDIVNASNMQDPLIFGGLGDDIIVGSPLADLIFGGSGNDTISGLGGDDTIYGEAGNDTITGGTGSDNVFGGADSDLLIWNQGDGSDLVEGGTGNDVVLFNGATAAEVAVEDFTLSAQTPALDSTRILLERTQGGVQLDIGAVEQINLVGGTGVENVQVNDLTHTDLQILNIDAGADGETESIRVEGRPVADDISVVGQEGGLILGNQPDVVFVIDISSSTGSGFAGTPVGDLNGDGTADTILDAEIAGFIRLNQELIARGLGAVADVSIVAFNGSGVNIDLDPVAAGVQISTTPLADADANGVLDVEQALRSLLDSGSTSFDAALDTAIATFTTLGTTPGNGNLIFLSDGDGGGGTADEVATLTGLGVNIKAFGVGAGASLPNLQIIDPAAFQFTTTDELLAAFGGGLGGNAGPAAVSGPIKVAGLQYDVNIYNSNVADTDHLTVDGNQGDDQIWVQPGVEAVIVTTLEGGLGDDHLSGGFNTANGGNGDDFIRGAGNDQMINGGAGEDTMVGGAGLDTFDGGSGFDTILVEGFASDDRIDLKQDNPTTLRYEVGNVDNGFDGVLGGAGTETDTLVINTVEQVSILAGQGDDTIRVTHDDSLVAAGVAIDMLRINVEGGDPGASDRLSVIDDGAGDTTVQRLGQTDGDGSFTMYAFSGGNPANPIIALPPVVYTDVEYASLNPLGPVTGGTGADSNGRLFVFKYDPYEQNQSLPTATFLGADGAINLDPNIDPGVDVVFGTPGDEDWYGVVADQTGTLDFQVYFRQQGTLANGRAGLPNDGNLDIAVFDADGLVSGVPLAIAGNGNFGTNDADDNERVRIPAVAGQTYYLRVVGAGLPAGNDVNASPAINAYTVSIVNDAPATPYDLELNDILQVGTVSVNAANTTTFTATLAPANPSLVAPTVANDYIGKTVEFTSGLNIGRQATITSFVAGTFTLAAADNGLIANPQAGDTFLVETTDTGRSQFDNATRDNTPVITFRLDDDLLLLDVGGNVVNPNVAPDQQIPIPFNPEQTLTPTTAGYRVPVFIEGNPQQPGTAPQTPIGYARPLAGTPGVYIFDFGVDAVQAVAGVDAALTLTDGSHFISAKVEITDPSSDTVTDFAARSESLEIVVDTNAPEVYFGDPAVVDDGLHPDSDSGDAAFPATLSDNVTNDTTPTFFGRAEANSIIRAYVDRTNDGFTADDILIGQTVTSPLDGSNQHPFGEWEITSTVNMNDPLLTAALGADGVRNIYVTAEDLEGNTSAANLATLQLFLDTRGPQVTGVFITNRPDFDLFTLKPATPEPTPRVDSITINVQDLPNRVAAFLYPAISNLAVQPNVLPLGLISLVGDHSGIIPMTSVTFTSDGNLNLPGVQPLAAGTPATGFITLQFAEPLPDDRFTLTLSDSIIDPAGNALDGESNASEPVGTPLFPSGDGIPGGDFVARFTVDSRPEVATWSQELVYVDINGNFVWDPEGQDNDATNRDFTYHFGTVTDAYFAGNFAATGAATASGFDKLGTFGRFNGTYGFFLDTNDDGIGDTVGSMFYQVNVSPVAGDFNAAHPGDEIGGYDGQFWYLDMNGNNRIDAGERFATELRGIPVVGDFNGDGNDDLAVYDNVTGEFQFDLDRNGTIDDRLTFHFSGFGEKPVTGDVNLDGVDDLVLWVPNRDGQLPENAGEFHYLVSDNPAAALPSAVFDSYSPAPLGNDLIAQFGDDFALPLLGNFDPPIGDVEPLDTTGWFTNLNNSLDVDNDGYVDSYDALLVINALNRGITSAAPSQAIRVQQAFNGHFLDVDGNTAIDPYDVLLIINELNRRGRAGQGEAAPSSAAAYAAAVDSVFSSDEDDDDLLLDFADNDALRSTL